MKLLVVEDAKGMRKLMVAMLRSIGYADVVEATHGGEAWDEIRQQPPDLLLTDWNMPVMDGIELVEKVRQDPAYDEMPILMFTARSAREDVVRALQAGVDTYVAKPFTPKRLKVKIDSIVGKRSLRRVAQLLNNTDRLRREDEHPLLVFGEGATTARQLNSPDQKEVMRFLSQAAGAIERVNSRGEETHLGYLLECSTSDISARLRTCGARLRMMMLAVDLPGGGATLARLVSINRRSSLAVFVVCHVQSEIPTKERFGLEHLGITVFERHLMDAQALEDLINEYVMAPIREGAPAALPAPEEIRQRVENDIRTMVSLPVLPQVYNEIMALDRQPDSDIQEWVDAIEADPLSQAQVIRRAHSPIYGFRGEINNAGKAVLLLGKNVVKELVVSSAVKRSFEGIQEDGFDVEDFWLHSVAVAFSARLLSFPLDETAWTPDQRKEFDELELEEEILDELRRVSLHERFKLTAEQDPYVAGMMHDIGKMALVQAFPGLFAMIVDALKAKFWQIPMLEAEQTVAGGADHALVGRILAESWKLGDPLIEVVEKHHDPGESAFVQLLALADLIGSGIYPYPKTAAFPAIELLAAAGSGAGKSEKPADPAPASSDNPKPAADGADEGSGDAKTESKPLDARAAVEAFMPAGLLETLELSMENAIDLGRVIAPAVRRLTEGLRKSL